MEFKEGKIGGLYVISGLLIGLTLWFSYDRIEKGMQNKKAEKYFENLMDKNVIRNLDQEVINIKNDSFVLVNQQGNRVTVYPASGKIIFINIWATWNISCIENLPALSRFYDQVKGKIDLYLITGEKPEKVQRMLKNQKVYIPCYYFSRMQDLPDYLQQTELPYSCIIYDGKIVFEYSGIAPWDSEPFMQYIDELPNVKKEITHLVHPQKVDVLNVINFN